MKLIKKIIENPFIIFILMAKELFDLGATLISSTPDLSIKVNPEFDYYDFGIKLIMSISLWLLLRAYFKLKDKIEKFILLQKEISQYRAYHQYKGNWVEYQKGFIDQTIIVPKFEAEEKYIRKFLIEKFPDLTENEIEKMMDDLIYNINESNRTKQ